MDSKSNAKPSHREESSADETTQSVASNDSQQMIIRREVMWTVTYDDENPRDSNNQHPHNRVDVEAQSHSNIV